MDWAHIIPSLGTAFLASLVECIEALTVILAVGAVLGWRGALIGTGLALVSLLALVIVAGPLLTAMPVTMIHLGVGLMLLVFGARWLRKAILRAAGVIPLRDEVAAYARQTGRFNMLHIAADARVWVGLAAAFQITMVEGIEVVFIVIAIGAVERVALLSAGFGALAAFLLVCIAGIALHRPIARIPENSLKFVVGVLSCAFGIFWIGEGVGVAWPGEDWSVLFLAAAILAGAMIIVRRIQARVAEA